MDVPDGTSVQLNAGNDPYDEGPAVDLDFIRGLPADSVAELNLTGDFVPASFAAVAHLAPGLRAMSVYIDELGPEAPSVVAELTGLERLSLAGHADPEDGPSLRPNDHALSVIADLPDLESLALLGGSYTEHGLQQLRRLPKLAHLHIEREDLTASIFRFAADMPALTRLTGLDEFGDEGPMPPAQVEQVRQCSRTPAWTDQPGMAGIWIAQLHRTRLRQRSLGCALRWPNSGHTHARRSTPAVSEVTARKA